MSASPFWGISRCEIQKHLMVLKQARIRTNRARNALSGYIIDVTPVGVDVIFMSTRKFYEQLILWLRMKT